MFKSPSIIWKVAALGLVLVGVIIVVGGLPPSSAENGSPLLPTRMILPSAEPTTKPVLAAIQPSALPPTSLPTQEIALQPTTIVPTETIDPILLPSAEASSAAQAEIVPNQFTIQFAPGTSAQAQIDYVRRLGGTISQTITPLNTVVVTLPDAVAQQTLPPSPIVLQSEPDYLVTAQQTAPNDPYYSQQWALPIIDAPDAWPILPANPPTVVVAVIDSGICLNHSDLTGRILPGYDYVENDTTPQDDYNHGCGVAGIIAANTNNSKGIAGIAPNTMIMPLRVLDEDGFGSMGNVAAAITYAVDNGARLINVSLGGGGLSLPVQNAVNYAVTHNVMIIAAAGNTNGGAVLYPAAFADVVAVGSVDPNLTRSSFSAVGPQIDLMAPGSNIMMPFPDGSYGSKSGTSFAAPQVTGIAALEIARGEQLIQDGGIARVNVPIVPPTPIPTPIPTDKNGNPLPQSAGQEPTPTDTWAVILAPGSDPEAVAAQVGFENLGQVGTLSDTYLFRAPNSGSSLQAAQDTATALDGTSEITWFKQQFAHPREKRTPDDEPIYLAGPNDQWHLRNAAPGYVSLNMPSDWASGGSTGDGVQIAIVDDGLQHTHPDIQPNYVAADSYDFRDNNLDPAPLIGTGDCDTDDCHGTAAASVAAGADNPPAPGNPIPPTDPSWGYCGVGVAYGANLAGLRLRLVDPGATDAEEAGALGYHPDANLIYSNSWGPIDDGTKLEGPDVLASAAMINNINGGRSGLGTPLGNIYVWAAGNGRQRFDNINADGYANSRYVIAVGATDYRGIFAAYSEPGAPMLVTAPSSGSGIGIATADLMGNNGYNPNPSFPNDYSYGTAFTDYNRGCTKTYGGTSAAAPMVAGVVALMLEANPNLTWRDVQHILVKTAWKNDPTNSDWRLNAAGKNINHNYGFGMVDAAAAVTMAQSWTNVAPEISFTSDSDPGTGGDQPTVVNLPIPDNNPTGVTSTITVDDNLYVEHVEVVLNTRGYPDPNNDGYRGDLEITLTSPDGTQSRLMEKRIHDGNANGYLGWTFTTVRDWGEHSSGVWTLKISDAFEEDMNLFQDWQLIVYGTEAPPKPPKPLTPANPTEISTVLPWSTVNFTWDSGDTFGADPVQLEFQLDTVNPPVAASLEFPVSTESYETDLPLGTYYWRIRAVEAGGGAVDWANIPVRTISITTPTNQPPTLNYFIDGAPVLAWNHVTWATGYQIEISTTPTFTSLIPLSPDANFIPPTENTFTVTPPLTESRIYYWRVRARKLDGTWSATWSTVDSFTLDLPP